ncbi:MAG TPA: hypothetical protein VLN57_19540 [Xanthobacteraceae bacterium]|nr:hypothetical protein [Xanthobacteraceae bacterium]
MPMSFPDLQSLLFAAQVWKFRPPAEGEDEAAYRTALADHVEPEDFIEAHEIRTGKGHDEWSEAENNELIRRVDQRRRGTAEPR